MIRTSLNILSCWLNRRSSTLVEERTSKKKKSFSRKLPLNRKKITRFSHCCSQPVFATPWSFAPFRSRAFHFARLVPLHRDVFSRLSSYNFLPRIGTATSISKLLARTINSPPPLSREYTPPKMATTRVALKKDLHVWSLLPSFVVPFLGFISFRNKVWEVRDERTMNIFGRIDI